MKRSRASPHYLLKAGNAMSFRNVPIALFALSSFAVGLPLVAQNYPLPVKAGQPAAVCTGCKSLNSAGQPNAGKPTVQYDAPLVAFAGRVVDSQATQNIQHLGMRTLRAGIVRTAYSQRGEAPPRVYAYIGLGTFGAYSLDTFPTVVRSNTVTVREVAKRSVGQRTTGPEKVARPDAVVYPEKAGLPSPWRVPVVDSAERLKDFDFDDRGYVYLAYDVFGFGIVKDAGQAGTSISTLQLVPGSQQIESLGPIQPDKIISVKASDGRYYVAVSYTGSGSAGRRIFDVTNPAVPKLAVQTSGAVGRTTVIRDWARDDAKRIVAVVAQDNLLRIYTYDAFVRNAPPVLSPIAPRTKFASVTFDEDGALWVAETPLGLNGKARIRRFVYTADGPAPRLVETAFEPFPEWFEPGKVHVRNGYLAAVGKVKRGPRSVINGFLFKIAAGGIGAPSLTNLDTHDFFLKYYHSAPAGFAQPAGYTSSPQDVHILTTGGKTYLMYMVFGLGDVYEISG
jgi:hypothetical protein